MKKRLSYQDSPQPIKGKSGQEYRIGISYGHSGSNYGKKRYIVYKPKGNTLNTVKVYQTKQSAVNWVKKHG